MIRRKTISLVGNTLGLLVIITTMWFYSPAQEPTYWSKTIPSDKPSLISHSKRDFKLYKRFLENPGARKEALTADDLEKLWESAFVYRDRIGAGLIAFSIKDKSHFWHSCFMALSSGSDVSPANMKSLSQSDIPTPRMEVFNHLFRLNELRSCPFKSVKMYVKLIEHISEEDKNHEHLGPRYRPATLKDRFLLTTKPTFWKIKDKNSQFETDPVIIRFKTNMNTYVAACVAFESSEYKTGDKYLKIFLQNVAAKSKGVTSLGPSYVGDLPYLLYMSGHSIYGVDEHTLRTDDGRIIHLPEHYDTSWVNFLLTLSKERDTIFKLRNWVK